MLDEIQSGIGRTGDWFAHQREGVLPDVMTLAKGLGGGLPIGACIGIGRYGSVLGKGDHGSTFGGNPIACAAALAVLDTIEKDGLLANVSQVGSHLAAGIGGSSTRWCPGSRERAVAGDRPHRCRRDAVAATAQRAGFLVNAVQPDAVRLAPPLILYRGEADTFIAALPGDPRRRPCAAGRRRGERRAAGRAALHQGRRPVPGRAGRGPGARRAAEGRGAARARALAGPQTVAVLFDKPSLRTRVSFAVGVAELGGYPLVIERRAPSRPRRDDLGHDQGAGQPGARRSSGAPSTRSRIEEMAATAPCR